MLDLAYARDQMVERQLARRGIRSSYVLNAVRTVPREAFVPEGLQEFAYEDTPLPIEAGQTISQPYIVAAMIEAAAVRPGDQVLEIGAGSGYAAAVLSRIAARVYAIERHEPLSRLAGQRLARLGYDNVEIRTGDGTKGWPEAAPFDAILVAAGGPAIPQALKEQLDVGGRLVIPIGEDLGDQRLVKVTRKDASHFEEEDLGGVRFVPLVGEHGWREQGSDQRETERRSFEAPTVRSLPELIAEAADPLPELDDRAFGAFFDRFASAQVVLLGEASHGTSEFYRARAAITRRLIEQHGFSIVAVEADWPDAASLDRYVRERPAPAHAEPPFRRFPSWMWRNTDVEAFIEDLRNWNLQQPADRRAGFYGLDLYNLSVSMRAVLDYLDQVDPEAAQVARQRYGCLTPWANEPRAYGRMALTRGYAACEEGVVKTLTDLLAKQLQYVGDDGENFIDAAANARLVKNAEAYYRAMYYGAAESWNRRDTHMFETLCALLEAKGPNAKAVVWAHNSHIGDASKTEMGAVRGELNIGQLCRERFGERAALIGFGTHTGTVTCASDWDEPMETKRINPSRPDSYERLAHDSRRDRFLLDVRAGVHESLRAQLLEPRLERFIGVIYRPETEHWSHYSACVLPQQFDAYVWFDETTAVTPLPTRIREGADDTYPFGL
ncbi:MULTISPECIES: protein-L-isoaspartate(D-aspartate) O-methyltransferase [unclassified Bradyrhizobium]|uniref:protein-L-isoaspartate(D-aspartate) O-methyltransferase n=1 Tax=unclassified Bradyrhizobium TaxID=2631580 RepID=UPI001FFC2107|nr:MULTISPECIES: protein-L-isoaspartate(D-aspartate) O-methyltransferase [unclassified Bradyrhizobium]MCK1711460.1 protein-L-isoaspartate(D-aspartate) O-methyltransferase [Bradyrhizobium sp. 143]MCK1732257.1 protein-L-isoaspartate(D-aspartate) O-methyltransferase [Bradyrhizobium sp. 142]